MTKQQIEKYLKEKCSLTEIFAVFPHVRDWIMVAYRFQNWDYTEYQFVFKTATENIQSALCKTWETVRKELEENTNEK